ncbi:MAG: amino acid ABC transporter permease [Bacillota bacterium]|nr:amino acid ABC transporter permease [Bacillota bacterium]
MTLNLEVMERYFPFLLGGAWLTLRLTVITTALGTAIGLFTAVARLSRLKIVSWPAAVYVDFFRGTPLLAQIALIHWGLPQLFGYKPNMVVDAIAALSINCGAYVTEIFRAGIQSIERGQTEAALSLGMTPVQAFRYVILPQAFRRVLPPLGNEFIAMLKDSSMVAIISMEELMFRGMISAGRSFRPFEIYILVALLYLAMTLPFTRLVAWMEIRLKREHRREGR